MKSILMPCLNPIWNSELELARAHDADAMIRDMNHPPGKFSRRRMAEQHYLGYASAIIETTIHGWRLVDTYSPGGRGVIINNRQCFDLLFGALEWYNKMPHHRELVVASIVPSKRDEFQEALRRTLLNIF